MYVRFPLTTLALFLFAGLASAQSPPLCQVSGRLHLADGSGAANAQLTIVKVAQNGAWLDGYPQTVAADTSGSVAFALPQNSIAYLQVNAVDGLNVVGGVPVQIPNTATTPLETLWLYSLTSFNGRFGDVTLSAADVTAALGFLPANSSSVPVLGSSNTFSGANTFTGSSLFSGINVTDNAGIAWTQATAGHGNVAISTAENVFNGTNDPSIVFGYNATAAGGKYVPNENSLSWNVEGDYNDGSGNDKMEAYLQYNTADGATNMRPLFFQFDRVTNKLTSSSLLGQPVQLARPDGVTSIAQFGNPDGSSVIGPLAGSDNVLSIVAPAGRTANLWLGARGTPGTLRVTAASAVNSYVSLGTASFRFYNSNQGSQFAVGPDDNSASGVFSVQGNAALKGVIARGMAGQSADLFQAQDSNRNVLASITKDGALSAGRVVSAKTANYSVQTGTPTANDRNTFFTNSGAIGEVDFTLPFAVPGLTYTFYVDAPRTVKVIANGGATIQVGSNSSISGGSAASSTSGNCLTLVAISATRWVTQSHEGNWTLN